MNNIPDRIHYSLKQRFKRYCVQKVDREVTLCKLYAKHDGICQDCGIKTEYLHPPQPHSASIEHITPLSKGGTHTWSNVTLLCHKCNTDKNTARQIELNKKEIQTAKTFKVFGFEIEIRRAS